jgi:Flp pilus assembly pilin Flp
MKKLRSFFKKSIKDQRGQGTAEYVLLIAIVVALVFAFRGRIMEAVKGQIENVGGQIEGFSAE